MLSRVDPGTDAAKTCRCGFYLLSSALPVKHQTADSRTSILMDSMLRQPLSALKHGLRLCCAPSFDTWQHGSDVIYGCPRSHKTIDKLFWWFNTLFLAVFFCFDARLGLRLCCDDFRNTRDNIITGKTTWHDGPRISKGKRAEMLYNSLERAFFVQILYVERRGVVNVFFSSKGTKENKFTLHWNLIRVMIIANCYCRKICCGFALFCCWFW